jgi:hypothetical protein
MTPLSIDEWSEALVPLWKEYFLISDDDVDLRNNDLLPPLLQLLELLRECSKSEGGFLANVRFIIGHIIKCNLNYGLFLLQRICFQCDLLNESVVTIHCQHLFGLFGDEDAYECFIVGHEHYLRSVGLALCMVMLHCMHIGVSCRFIISFSNSFDMKKT